MKTDPSLKVKDTTAWTLAKAAEFHPNIIFENGNIVPVLETLVMSLNSEANVASQACYVPFFYYFYFYFFFINCYYL